MTRFAAPLLAMGMASMAQAQLVAQTGSEAKSTCYATNQSGFLFFSDGSEALLFRAGVTA